VIIPGILASGISGHLSTNNYTSIQTVTVGSGGASSISFSSIPSTYTHLQIRGFATYSTVGAGYINFNGDSGSNYSAHWLFGDGSNANAGSATSQTKGYLTGAAGTKNTVPNASITDIMDYANTNKNKTVRTLYGWDGNGSGYVEFNSSLWMSTNAITSIVLTPQSGTFNQYTNFALYGVK